MKNLKIPQSVKTALITGGDGDIGFQFAHKLAKNKISLILVSNREDGLKKAKEKLKEEFNVNVEIFYSDLAAPHAAQEVYNFCAEKKIEVDLLINNAGIFFFEEFISTKPEKILIMLNLQAFWSRNGKAKNRLYIKCFIFVGMDNFSGLTNVRLDKVIFTNFFAYNFL